jgi:hypothetical protein
MRLIAVSPEFSWGGTVFIVLVPTVFGACVALAHLARLRNANKWSRLLSKAACVVTFILFGSGGGAPLMLNVLLGALAFTRRTIAIAWTVAPAAVVFGTVGDGPIAVAISGPVLAIALSVWKVAFARSAPDKSWIRLNRWVDSLARAIAVLLAGVAFVIVCVEVAHGTPALLTIACVLYYLALLIPLFVGLLPALMPSCSQPSVADAHVHPGVDKHVPRDVLEPIEIGRDTYLPSTATG